MEDIKKSFLGILESKQITDLYLINQKFCFIWPIFNYWIQQKIVFRPYKFLLDGFEASLLDQINMTESWLDYDQKNFTPQNLNVRTWLKFTTPTNINFTPKNMLVRSAWTGPPAPACKLALAGIPAEPCFAPLQEKKSGTDVRRTPDVRLRFMVVNLGHVQFVRFVVVMIRSYSLGHLDLVK